jgi:hypothetical protein
MFFLGRLKKYHMKECVFILGTVSTVANSIFLTSINTSRLKM